MRNAFIIITASFSVVLAYIYPLVAVVRGRPLGKIVLRTWLWLVTYLLFLCLLLPGLVTLVSRELGREMFRTWVPEGPGVVAALFVGWLPPLVAGLVALALRWFLARLWPRALSVLESQSDETENA